MQTCYDAPLGGLLDSVQVLSLVNILPLCQGLRIDIFPFCGLDIAEARRRVKAGQVVSDQDFYMRNIDILLQDISKVFIRQHIICIKTG